MAPNGKADKDMIWSATYSNVPVYEFNVDDNHVMRRRRDGWINATQILKVADFDKPARTRILEREVQKGIHEKVQGGYGKYQGTWIPLELGQQLAEKNGVYEKLKPIFEYIPGDITPPPAPKHTTAASNKPKAPRAPPVRKPAKIISVPVQQRFNDENYDNISAQLNDDDTPDNSTVVSESMIDEDDYAHRGHHLGSRKRKRVAEPPTEWSKHEEEHRLYADALLDYFVLQEENEPQDGRYNSPPPPPLPPVPPASFQVDRPIDNQNHTALHWAAAMGDVNIVKDLLRRGANIRARNIRGETPLIRACLFENCYEKETMRDVLRYLRHTITIPDDFGGTVFHHTAHTAHTRSKAARARYYINILLNTLMDSIPRDDAMNFLNAQDQHGDTAFHIAARNSRRCTRAFQGAGVASDIPNNNNETVDQYLQNTARQYKKGDQSMLSSSPITTDPILTNGRELGIKSSMTNLSFSQETYQAQASKNFSESFGIINQKAADLVEAGEAEIQQMNGVLADAERLLQITTNERAAVRNKLLQFSAMLEDDTTDHLQEEDRALVREAEAIQEQIQHRAVHALVQHEEAIVYASTDVVKAKKDGRATNQSNGDLGDDDVQTKYLSAIQLSEEQGRRRELTREVVRCLANEGMSETGEKCRRLVMMTLRMPEEHLPDMVDDVLEELEMSNNDHGAIAVDNMIVD
ncbi:hypothetical protein MMC30_009159 [Trapelia coarctata]|nr:hypothetical protein [Trapelia coarctata]